MSSESIISLICDVIFQEVYPAKVSFKDGIITDIENIDVDEFKDIKSNQNKDFNVLDGVLLPGFIESHIHIESSMLTPSNFSKVVIPHGTTTVIADPHEIANVLGIGGINFMIDDASHSPLNFYFTAPSCVPSTPFETSGAILSSDIIEKLLELEKIVSLGEVMNFKGVISNDMDLISKIKCSKKFNKPIDGHAPLLTGKDLKHYVSKGISTDHESSNLSEAIEKAKLGMKIMVREGSSAKNMEDIININNKDFHLIKEGFFCSDDIHTKDLSNGHLNIILKKAVNLGMNPFDAIKMVTFNPANHYNLNTGSFSIGKNADFVLVDNLNDFNVKKVFINGKLVSENGKINFNIPSKKLDYKLNLSKVSSKDFDVNIKEFNNEDINFKKALVNVIKVSNGQLITEIIEKELNISNGIMEPNVSKDIIKIAVLDRYGSNNISNAFIQGFNIKDVSLASSIAHDSHNIVVIGTDSKLMAECVNLIIKNNGGLAIVTKDKKYSLELPIAGLMTNESQDLVVKKINKLHDISKERHCKIDSPFTTLSFMSLLVIPHIKLSDKGLFNVDEFDFISLAKKFY